MCKLKYGKALDYDCEVQGQQDIPQAIQLLGEMNSNVKQVTDLVEGMLQRVKRGELSTEYGLSFLEVKYHMLLDYLINLTYVVLRKCSGETIEGDPSIERLIEIRTVLEKIRPIDYKLRYQIDKLVKTATTGVSSSTDPILYKPNPEDMLSAAGADNEEDDDAEAGSDSDADEDEDDEAGAAKKPRKAATAGKSGVYVPPRIKPVYYDGDERDADKEKKALDRAKKRAITSSMLQDLKEEYLDAPTELSSGSRAQQLLSQAQKEKQEYEEDYLMRLPITKAEKHRQRKLTTLGTLGDEILGEISRESTLRGDGVAKKRKLAKSRGKGKKRGGKKRKFH
ncbi:LOW QUALITY PROTEIN: neuroguidin [Drosophila sulfurigaster albostrigata]|uniref:LOW QUALITY PROTEIN: neuroguidin n=1 Tax=Drosophila sulfurigaster albostrigata TaxID=89887 RepID=UPI002D21939C|nr:LOW QUALITY PROTEIN: neuroguidin [Drosophila sulfurigaster albostrigata]